MTRAVAVIRHATGCARARAATVACLPPPAALTLLCLLAAAQVPAAAWGRSGLAYPLVFVQEPAELSQGGSRVVALDPGGGLTVLTEGFHAAADPCVSFDGTWVLFAGKLRASDPFEVWEMAVDGSRKVRVTSGMEDCREPAYLGRAAVDAPEFRDRVRWVTFVSAVPQAVDELGRGPLTALYALSLEPVPGRGTVVWRTTYNLGGDRAPTVLGDGRVLFSSWQRDGYALMTMSWAGEDLNPFFGSHDGPVSQLSACEVAASRRVVFVERDGDAGDGSGQLVEVSLRRPLHSRRVLGGGPGRYRTPQATPEGRLLVAHAQNQGTYGLYLFDEEKGRPGPVLFDAPDWHDVDPQPVAPRPEPTGRIPMVSFASVLDVGGFHGAGQLQCMSVYETDRPEVARIGVGQVKAVRLVEGIPLSPAEAQHGQRTPPAVGTWPPPFVRTRPLGEAPVEADGSFYVNVAGDVPFYIESLGEGGEVLATMRAWTWVRSGDQRGCIGCHENKELAPPNRATEALIKGEAAWMLGPRQQEEAEAH
ncbi:MAG: hypothetical protein AB1505_01315 [Candidatus Latescibacterota bacterium]